MQQIHNPFINFQSIFQIWGRVLYFKLKTKTPLLCAKFMILLTISEINFKFGCRVLYFNTVTLHRIHNPSNNFWNEFQIWGQSSIFAFALAFVLAFALAFAFWNGFQHRYFAPHCIHNPSNNFWNEFQHRYFAPHS